MSEKSVLLIDDDESMRRVMEYTLLQAGYRVLTASDGEEGVRLFRQARPPVLITDIQMPGLSGYDVLRTVKEENADTLVIVVTAFGTVEKAVEAMKLGAYDCLTKPFKTEELKTIVEKTYEKKKILSENLLLQTQIKPEIPGIDPGHLCWKLQGCGVKE